MVNSTVDGKVNHKEETMEVSDVIITSIRIIGLLLLLAGVLLLLLHLDNVMNLGVVTCHTHWCCQTPNISTADHIPALIEEHSS